MARLISEDLPGWAPGTNHYELDGKYVAVEVDPLPDGALVPLEDMPLIGQIVVRVGGNHRQSVKYVARPTVVFLTDEAGLPVDADENDNDPLTPIRRFPAGTTHEQALAELGY